mmetsp:Transcript_53902/g.63031  ORF Transcript_53902/g.63031 Transcript_53902/m.63031 type:complete len:340 (+) Transcript_53902:141-1160(+)|eukprot:CAMPEP_0194373232 /NCGR_PEP_ID=MMETSP0174-20130528/21656_1 /TAXON_ID=216777 /ORGANISM="Proboscia alata, Strain PI-D3" /LENGTH=339 /DNA_ID=CAMNT_0039152187 /DNA_START=134 /DNA_END=1153 /DNA_ORIENTATION=+
MSNASAAMTIRNVLEEHVASEIFTHKNCFRGVVELDSNMTTFDASTLCFKSNIRSAPVWDKPTEKYIGFFETRDVLGAVVSAIRTVQDMKKHEDKSLNSDDEAEAFDQAVTDSFKKIDGINGLRATIKSLAAKNAFVPFHPESPLIELCPHLWGTGNHRVPILDKEFVDGKCINIISRTDLVRFLSSNLRDNPNMNEKINESTLKYRREVVKVVDETSALEAFELIDSKNLSGIAIVDDEGHLVGNSSASDIKCAISDKGREASLDMDILSYLACVRQANLSTRFPSAHIYEDATIGQVINKMAKTGYHRIFVADKDKLPVGVISVGDIIQFALDGNVG